MLKSTLLQNIKFCITGKTSIPRKQLERVVAENSGENASIDNIGRYIKEKGNKNYGFLVTNDEDSGSSKNKKAKQLGIIIISERFKITY